MERGCPSVCRSSAGASTMPGCWHWRRPTRRPARRCAGRSLLRPMPEAAASSEEQRARSALAAMGMGGAGLRLQRAALPVLVPMHRAVESECWIADAGESETVFLKLLCEDMRPFVDAAAALEASLAGAALGVAPAVKGHDAGSGAIALELLGEGWRTAGMASLQDPGIRAAAIAAQRRFQDGPA